MSIHSLSTNTMLPSCLVIGGGISGLLAATLLQRNNILTTVLDKGRGIGGRLATRRIENPPQGEGIFDYGAQSFTVTDPKFKVWVDDWIQQDVVEAWSDGFPCTDGQIKKGDGYYYRGIDSNRSIAEYLAKDLEVYTSTRIVKLQRRHSQWVAQVKDGTEFQGDIVVMTAPLPQSRKLLKESDIALTSKFKQRLERIDYDPCITVMALLKEPSQIPDPGGLWLDGTVLSWIGCNYQKGISPDGYAVTLHASPEFSRIHWEDENEDLVSQLLAAAAPWLPSEAIECQLHRWRYSQPHTVYGEPYVVLQSPGPIVLAGDAFLSGTIEGAALSGIAAANYVLSSPLGKLINR
ncbi:MAG: NAD(P)-binding protein [Cyanothece sp. SIO1E1]|nr:NAD(P)-binding protein [Cyanothece sp. SIO1E1]